MSNVTDNITPEELHEVISAAAQIVAQQLHTITQERLTQSVREGVSKMHQLYPTIWVQDDRIEALMRREICRGIRDRADTAARAWDDILFRLSNEEGAL